MSHDHGIYIMLLLSTHNMHYCGTGKHSALQANAYLARILLCVWACTCEVHTYVRFMIWPWQLTLYLGCVLLLFSQEYSLNCIALQGCQVQYTITSIHPLKCRATQCWHSSVTHCCSCAHPSLLVHDADET